MSALWLGLVALALVLLGRELYHARTRVGRTSRPAPGLATLLSPLSSFNSFSLGSLSPLGRTGLGG